MKPKRILIVDNDVQLVESLTRECQQIGLEVQTANSVYNAMALLDAGLPDLICLDILMPSDNGLSICEMIETDETAAKIPVIVLAEWIDQAAIRRCGNLCAYHVQKGANNWKRIEPVIYELVDINPPVAEPTADTRQREET